MIKNKKKHSLYRIAIVKYGGMSAGGTERYLRNLANGLDKDKFQVTFFYCDPAEFLESSSAQMQSEERFVEELKIHKVSTVKFRVGKKNDLSPKHDWIDTDFFNLFDESSFDLLITGRAGHPEYPFYRIRKIPIIDTLHLDAGIDWQPNICRTVFLSNWSLEKWVNQGGSRKLTFQSGLLMEKSDQKVKLEKAEIRSRIGVNTEFAIGMHQRASDGIFSPMPIEAFSKICRTHSVTFLLLGGGLKYRKQVRELDLEEFVYCFDFDSGLTEEEFLCALDIYSHGRKDGEINSLAIAKALEIGLPVVSHISDQNNGHIECIGDAGYVVHSVEEYEAALIKILSREEVRINLHEEAILQFNKFYNYDEILTELEELFGNVIQNSYKLKYKLKTSKTLWRLWFVSYRIKRRFLMNGIRKR